jgi:hypothetical protein
VPLLPLFTTFGATAEPKIIKILIYGYHTLLGINSYVYDDDKSIKRSFNFIKPSGVPLFEAPCVTFGATAQTPKLSKSKFTANISLRCNGPIRLSEGPIRHFDGLIRLSKYHSSGSQMALSSGSQNTLSGSQMTLSASQMALSGSQMAL